MLNHKRSPVIYDSALLNKIATQLCKTVVTIYYQKPELLTERYRKVQWENPANQLALTNKLRELLGSSQNWEELIKKIEVSFTAILVNEVINSPPIQELFTEIRHHHPIYSNNNNNGTKPDHTKISLQPLGIAVLLLDAENLQINTNTEKFLATVCHLPIQVKIAFANWSNRGKLDIELHERGYDLIHVPAGRDNADGKMIAFGASIHELYPNAKAVFVCSSDKVMTNLCNHLQQHGLIVYQVSQHGENINIINNKTGETTVHNIKPSPELPSINQFITQLKTILQAEKKLRGVCWMKLSQLVQNYKHQYQLSVSLIVSRYLPGKQFRDILINYPADFVIHQIDDGGEVYVSLFTNDSFTTVHQDAVLNGTNSNLGLVVVNIESPLDLETAIKNILMELSAKSENRTFDISILASKFKQKYNKPITEQMKELQIGGSFVKFLQSCSSLEVTFNENKWEVSEPASSNYKSLENTSAIHSALDLEQALKIIILELTNNSNYDYVDASVLGVKFHHKYGKPITKQMKDIQINGSFIKFLESCSSFQIQQQGNKYKVLIYNHS
ncbi:MAG: NYN domain-containing protein [Sphaerospermopsis sp. SIO1G1]|nr:NYN domain-containing protein [Sphaerospermopsis sp. SIO1G1]